MDRPAGSKRRAAIAPLIISLGMVFLFVWLFSAALHQPQPHGLPIGFVGPAMALPSVEAGLEAKAPGAFAVTTYASAEEFYRSDFKTSPGCLILDIRLPGISGFELQTQLLDSGIRMPVIFMTGQDRAGMEEYAMQLGASAYLRKPVDEETLLGAIRLAMKLLAPEKDIQNVNGS